MIRVHEELAFWVTHLATPGLIAMVFLLVSAGELQSQHPPLPGPPSGLAQPETEFSVVAGGSGEPRDVFAGDALMYIGTYEGSIYVLDEAEEKVVDRIPLETGIPRNLDLSADGERFYVRDISYERVEVVDVATRKTLDVFTLSEGDEKIRIWGMEVAPGEEYAILLVRSYRKLSDRFEIGDTQLLQYDLAEHQVIRELPWPDGRPRERMNMRFSQDGGLLYMFVDDVRVYDTREFSEVDRWDYSDAMGDGVEELSFGFPDTPYEDPGIFTGLFRVTDPVQDRRMMGVARGDLDGRDFEFTILGPDEPGLRFALAPNRRSAFILKSQVDDYQFWTLDLDAGRVLSRQRFAGRPRMTLLSSSNGEVLYIYNAGNTIDLYRADGYEYLRTIVLDADTTTDLIILPPPGGSTGDI